MYVLSFHDNCLHVLNYSACTLHMPVKYSVLKNTGRQQGLFVNKKIKWGWESIQSHNQLCDMYNIRIDYSWPYSITNTLFLWKCLGVSLIRKLLSRKENTHLTHTIIIIMITLVIPIFTIAINVTAYIMTSLFSVTDIIYTVGFLWTVARLPDLLLTAFKVMQLGSSENPLIVNKTLPGISFKLMRQWKIILMTIYQYIFLYHWKVRTIKSKVSLP